LFHFGRIGLTSCNRGLQEKATKGLILESLGYYVTVVWESDMEEFIGTLK
jgi:hypothetical protein